MGKNPWEEPDQEVLALAATMQSRSPRRWLRRLVGLAVIAVLTFIGAYYVPLFRAHYALRDEYQELSERRRVLADTLASKQRDLGQAEKDKAALRAELDERAAQAQKQQQKLQQLSKKLSQKLRAAESDGLAAVSVAEGHVQVALHNKLVFSPHTLTLPPKRLTELCDVVEAAKGARLNVVAVTTEDEPPSVQLAAKYPSRIELGAARAAIVGKRLAEACPVSLEAASATGRVEAKQKKIAGVSLPAVILEFALDAN